MATKKAAASKNKRRAGRVVAGALSANIRIPRTHSAAKKRGFALADITFNDLSTKAKAGFAEFEGGGSGNICGMGPSDDPNFWLVCYKGSDGTCNWVKVPKGAPIPNHD